MLPQTNQPTDFALMTKRKSICNLNQFLVAMIFVTETRSWLLATVTIRWSAGGDMFTLVPIQWPSILGIPKKYQYTSPAIGGGNSNWRCCWQRFEDVQMKLILVGMMTFTLVNSPAIAFASPLKKAYNCSKVNITEVRKHIFVGAKMKDFNAWWLSKGCRLPHWLDWRNLKQNRKGVQMLDYGDSAFRLRWITVTVHLTCGLRWQCI